ncbi:MAG: N-acetyl-gamma-glutamyl-phosphate reductase [archaeon]|nr:N-acetyl-gamma-glutamyl-phosphate reductase [archaeon]
MTYRVGIIGGTGYTGSELSRLLCRHPDVELAALTSRTNAGTKVSKINTFLKGYTDIEFTEKITDTKDLDFVMVATPRGVAMNEVPALMEQGIKCIDLSGDYRLHDPAEYEKWYGTPMTDVEGLQKSVFGLPELFRDEIKGADLVANPGCYATSAILAIAPLMKSGLVHPDVFIDGKSGTSGAGMKPSERLHHPTCGESVIPYSVCTHRHQPEIDMAVGKFAGTVPDVMFVPHLIPIVRGIISSCYLRCKKEVTQEEVDAVYEKCYGAERFVNYVQNPSIRDVVGSNHAQVGSKVMGDRVVAFGVLDNLVKGASGQAVQNMNLMLGLDEAAGLDFPGLGV